MTDLSVIWVNSTRIAIGKEEIEQHLLDVLRRLKRVDTVEVELSLMTDKKIQTLKKRTIGGGERTDVLSFPYDGLAGTLTGSIAISVETAARQAKQAGIGLIVEVKMLASHGLLHILGYNHS